MKWASRPPNFALVKPIAQKVLDLYLGGEFDVVTLVYSRFKSVVTQTPTVRQLIPAADRNDRRQRRLL